MQNRRALVPMLGRRVSRRIPVVAAVGCVVVGCFGGVAAASTPNPVKVGVDPTEAPFGSTKGGTLQGFDVDVAKLFGSVMHVKVQVSNVPFADAVPAIKSGRIDVSFIGGYGDTALRRKQMDMVDYYRAYDGFLVKKGNPAKITSMKSLCGHSVATYTGAAFFTDPLQAASKNCQKRGKPAITISTFANLPAGELAVQSGRVDAWADLLPPIAYAAKRTTALQAVAASDVPSFVAAIGVSKADTGLADQIGKALETATKSGKMQKLFAKWGIPKSEILPRITVNTKAL